MPRNLGSMFNTAMVVARICHGSRGRRDLVGSPAEQGVGAPVDLAYEHRGLVVEVRRSSRAALESAAGVLVRPISIPCITPSTETNVVVSFMVAVPFSLVDVVGHGTVDAANRSARTVWPLSS